MKEQILISFQRAVALGSVVLCLKTSWPPLFAWENQHRCELQEFLKRPISELAHPEAAVLCRPLQQGRASPLAPSVGKAHTGLAAVPPAPPRGRALQTYIEVQMPQPALSLVPSSGSLPVRQAPHYLLFEHQGPVLTSNPLGEAFLRVCLHMHACPLRPEASCRQGPCLSLCTSLPHSWHELGCRSPRSPGPSSGPDRGSPGFASTPALTAP